MKTLCLLLASSGLLLISGCTNVKPWQRGALADPIMRTDWRPLDDSLQDHVLVSREAAYGGRSVGGGGCGCN